MFPLNHDDHSIKTMIDEKRLYLMDDTRVQFEFTRDDYHRLELATVLCGSFSMVAAMAVLVSYTHLILYYPRDANRVSLHCVIFATLLSLADHCLNLAALHYRVNDVFCSSFRKIDGVITLVSCCLLAVVGFHLLLVFCFHVRHWPCRPEYILFPLSIVYAITGNLRGFISNEIPVHFRVVHFDITYDCWYYSNLIDRVYNYSSWIYYYSFLTFIVIISFLCSLAAMGKVYLDKRDNQARLLKMATRADTITNIHPSQETNPNNERGRSPVQNTIIRAMKENCDPFSTIAIRSLLYPLIPCIVYIWGFGLQMTLIDDNHVASYAITMINVVMTRLEGVFIACIFFMDPSVQRAQRKLWSHAWHLFFPITSAPSNTSSAFLSVSDPGLPTTSRA
ncbi:hypothetical protein BC941DRAFT_159747 [Chlamydoabsidia padenii]|nr:hypothetical protein BC941DRAFT_159747 [Chlamydoabsidia padenii]